MANEFKSAEKAGLNDILAKIKAASSKASASSAEEVKAPPKEVVTAEIAGIEIMELDDAVAALWKAGIYAESGMGCTGPIVLISEANLQKAAGILAEAGFIS